ncbi:hypothetical protein SAMD00019534_122490, partial [Acytostelium subglobosum LB1]|uniref:hypothetical protein n=1 Tax=Acytostelium subglobosum LB1 TaxID=1410327 RepID=UPI0006448090
ITYSLILIHSFIHITTIHTHQSERERVRLIINNNSRSILVHSLSLDLVDFNNNVRHDGSQCAFPFICT